ncbi:MAG: nuclear transport factor 2 family protein [Actinomycetota bacterium]
MTRRKREGVRSLDFGPMMEQFTDDAELAFDGVPAGPFQGKEAIAAAYRTQPPDDEIDVSRLEAAEGQIVVWYAWRTEPERRGRMITPVGDKIARLTVTFDQEPSASAPPQGTG